MREQLLTEWPSGISTELTRSVRDSPHLCTTGLSHETVHICVPLDSLTRQSTSVYHWTLSRDSPHLCTTGLSNETVHICVPLDSLTRQSTSVYHWSSLTRQSTSVYHWILSRDSPHLCTTGLSNETVHICVPLDSLTRQSTSVYHWTL